MCCVYIFQEGLQKCEVYDPVFTEEEKDALTDLGLHVLNINEVNVIKL